MSHPTNTIWEETKREAEIEKIDWPRSIQNLFSANHRNLMLMHHKGTMAQIYTVEDIINEARYLQVM